MILKESIPIWLVKINPSGDSLWAKSFGGNCLLCCFYGYSVQQTTDGEFIVVGSSWLAGGSRDVWLIKTTPDLSSIEQSTDIISSDFSLQQNFPNPFNPSTKIEYSVPQASQVQIKVYDVLGNEVATLVNEEKPAGTYELTWNAASHPSGVYFYQLRAGSFVETKKMVLMK